MDLYRRYLHWNETPNIESFDTAYWWQTYGYQPLAVCGVAIFTFNDDLRHATMLEF